jgi:hypothetical protein
LSENQQGSRAEYAKPILVTVSRDFEAEYGRSFSYGELARMVQFAQTLPDDAIVVTQVFWSTHRPRRRARRSQMSQQRSIPREYF